MLHMETTIKEEKCLPGYPDEDQETTIKEEKCLPGYPDEDQETTIKEEKCLPDYPDEDHDVRTTDRVHSSIDDSLTNLNWLRKYSVPSAHPERSLLVGDTAFTTMPLHRPLAGEPAGTTMPLHRPLAGEPAGTTMPLHRPLAGEPAGTTMPLHHPLAGEPAATTMPLHRSLAGEPAATTMPLHPDASIRPPYSYASLIYRAIRDDKQSRMTLSNIYKWMADNFPYYRNSNSTTWQSSVRHTLSVNDCFVKVCKEQGEGGKGGYWQINPESGHKFVDAQKRKLLLQDYDAVAQEHKTVMLNYNIAVQGQQPNAAVQGTNTAVQGPNTAVQGPNTALQGPKMRKLLPQQQQRHNTVPQSHNIILQGPPNNNSGHDFMAQQGHNFVVQAGHAPGVQICTPSLQICFQICIPSTQIFTQQVSK